ncbi:hypothetical protein SORBI_3004G108900 [Sorghum bicolor]|uniref:Uncharacterized protein n=1 Tax=Sorghum bicolor TaxID=4558 RepID=A0A194YNZ8_SORBI|nr:hypothetical protein SORBI_3004G108900 [Sorghum bicolor]
MVDAAAKRAGVVVAAADAAVPRLELEAWRQSIWGWGREMPGARGESWTRELARKLRARAHGESGGAHRGRE